MAFVLAGLAAIGLITKRSHEDEEEENFEELRAEQESPTGDDIYHSNKKDEDREDEMERGIKNYIEAEEPEKTGRIPPHYNEYTLERQADEEKENQLRNKRIYEKSINDFKNGGGLLPPELVSKEKEYLSVFDKNVDIANHYLSSQDNGFFNVEEKFLPFDSHAETFMDLDRDLKMGSKNISLTGGKMEMYHGNMQPFFKSSVKQNVNDNIYQSTKLETFTGTGGDTYINKKEQKNRFKPEPNITHVYGAPNTITTQMKYYQPSMYRTGEKPFEPVRVAPGLNKGFNSGSEDGFHPKYRVHYKNVDDLRTANKPKKTYKAVTIPGKNVTQNRTAIAPVHKNRPEKFRELTSDDWFKTQGDHVAHRVYPQVRVADTNRATTDDFEYKGVANAQAIGKSTPNELKPRTKEAFKNETELERPGIVGANESFRKQGYSNNKYIMPETERLHTGTKTHQLALKVPTNSRYVKDSNDIAKITRKSGVVDMPLNKGGVAAGESYRRPYVKDSNDIAKITRKSGVVDIPLNKGGVAPGESFRRPYVKDANDIAKITRKSGVVDIPLNKGGVSAGESFRRPYVKDPSDIAKITRKQGVVDAQHNTGIVAPGDSFRRPYVKDPDDIARITRKQGVVDAQHNTGIVAAGDSFRKPYVKDPSDIARITRKQGIVDREFDSSRVSANTSFTKPYVKDPKDIAKVTRKQQTTESLKNDYTGNAKFDGSGAYQTTKFDPKDTLRQLTCTDYTGAGGLTSAKQQMTRENYMNAETNDRAEKVAKGRAPTLSGPKLMAGEDLITQGTNRKNATITDDVRLNVGIAHKNIPLYTQKHQLNADKTFEQDRVDLSVLDNLKVNPFHVRVLNIKNPY